jgi:hypothetical protein
MSRNRHIDTADNSGCARQEPSPSDRRRWAVFGLSAIDAGTPDRGLNGSDEDGDLTDAIDTVTNILCWLDHRGCADRLQILRIAQRHFAADCEAGGR